MIKGESWGIYHFHGSPSRDPVSNHYHGVVTKTGFIRHAAKDWNYLEDWVTTG
jgi:hypothetical protein